MGRVGGCLRGGVLAVLAALALGCPRSGASPAAKRYEAPDDRFVLFAAGRVDFASDGYFTVGYVAGILDGSPAYHVLIVGHADQAGKSDANREISIKRAHAVRRMLIDHGINEGRIQIAVPREEGPTISSLGRRADIFIYDPAQDNAARRIGYPVEIRGE